MSKKILVLKSPIVALEKNLANQGIKLHAPYQKEGVEWLIGKEKKRTFNCCDHVECGVCTFNVPRHSLSQRSCCKADICHDCIDEWAEKHDTCPYCRQDLLFKVDRKLYGGLLCDEMGLGKTLQMICLMKANKLKHTLIVLPPSIIRQWMNEFSKFAPEFKIILNYGESRPTKEFIENILNKDYVEFNESETQKKFKKL